MIGMRGIEVVLIERMMQDCCEQLRDLAALPI